MAKTSIEKMVRPTTFSPSERKLALLVCEETGEPYERVCARIRRGRDPYDTTKHIYAAIPHTLKARRAWLNSLKTDPCMDCHRSFPPVCMDFDHREPGEKRFNVGSGWQNSVESILEEIAKCDVVCANCHRIRTENRRLRHGQHH